MPPGEYHAQRLVLAIESDQIRMPKIIRERYENGVLVERSIEGSTFKLRKWAMLATHLLIAASLVVLAAVAVHDSLVLGNALSDEDSIPTSCEQPQVRS